MGIMEHQDSFSPDEKTQTIQADYEEPEKSHFDHGDGELSRQLKSRHIAMISIGGVIGTGLFLGTANSLNHGGPVGLVLGYIVMGSICISLMLSLGEMCSYLPIPGGHIALADRFWGSSASFSLGWIYWFNWIITAPAELSACAVLVSFWNDTINPAVWITLVLLLVVGINLLGARAYGETESLFASIKIITIIGLIIMGIVIDLGGGPKGDRIGFRYWKDPGPFVQYHNIGGTLGRFLGFYSVLSTAAFAFIGAEIVGMTAGEAQNPRRNIPRAVKTIFVRVCLFYVLGTMVISVLVPSNHPDLKLDTSTAAKSPFVIAIKTAGIKGLPSVINAAILSSAASAASSDVYASSRALHGLASAGNAPRIFGRTTKGGLPLPALGVSILFTSLSYMSIGEGSGKVFSSLADMSSICGLITWMCIAITYVRFRKGMEFQSISRDVLPFQSAMQPFLAWYVIVFIAIILITHGFSVFLKGNWDTTKFVTQYLPIALFPLLYLGHYFKTGSRTVRPEEMDFYSGLQKIIEAEFEVEPAKTWYGRLAQKVF